MNHEQVDFSPATISAPPANIEVEEAILGGLLIDPEAMERIADSLDADAFYISAHQKIYQACQQILRSGAAVNLFTVSNWLADHKLLADVGGKGKLAQLADRTVSAINIDGLAELIQDKYLSRRLISVGNEIIKLGVNQAEPISSRVDSAETKVFALRQKSEGSSDLKSVADLSVDLYSKIEALSTSDDKPALASGFYDLDALLGGGFFPGDLTVIAGRPSMGKSLLAHSIAFAISRSYDAPTAIFSLEMSSEQVLTRLLSANTRIPTSRLRDGDIRAEEWDRLAVATGELADSKVLIDGSSCPTAFEIRSKVRRAIAARGPLKLVVVDYLQLMADGSDVRLVQKLGEITRQLKLLARECNVPVIVVSQLNRDLESRNIKRPTLSDLRDSGRIEEDADIVLGIYRDAYYNHDSVDQNIAEIICLKQRNGPTGTVKLLFDGEYSQFMNLLK